MLTRLPTSEVQAWLQLACPGDTDEARRCHGQSICSAPNKVPDGASLNARVGAGVLLACVAAWMGSEGRP
jgi:hypothetical protein